MSKKQLLIAGLALAGALSAGVAQARERADVQWSVTIGAPAYGGYYGSPAPLVVQPARGDGYRDGYREYHRPTRWDIDGDGIPNRYDRVYNPRWDRNGDGIPDWREHRDGRTVYSGWGR
jgi:hypothetical protein